MGRFVYWWMTTLFVSCFAVAAISFNGDVPVGYVAQAWIYLFLLAGRARVTAYFVALFGSLRRG